MILFVEDEGILFLGTVDVEIEIPDEEQDVVNKLFGGTTKAKRNFQEERIKDEEEILLLMKIITKVCL